MAKLLNAKLKERDPNQFGSTLASAVGVPPSQVSKYERGEVADEEGELFKSQDGADLLRTSSLSQ